MNRIDRHNPAFAQRSQRRQNHIAAWSKRYGPVKLYRRPIGSPAHPDCTQFTRQLLM